MDFTIATSFLLPLSYVRCRPRRRHVGLGYTLAAQVLVLDSRLTVEADQEEVAGKALLSSSRQTTNIPQTLQTLQREGTDSDWSEQLHLIHRRA
jgi:hypothetical protein